MPESTTQVGSCFCNVFRKSQLSYPFQMHFETKRLVLEPLSMQDYLVFESGNQPNWQARGFTNPHRHLIEGPSPLKNRIRRVKLLPQYSEIALLLAVEKSSREIIGSAGFHDLPDEKGMIEIGFSILPEKQNRGFGTELLLGMWRMILERAEVKILRYTVAPENEPSMHIIKKFGFNLVGEQIDPEDGLELIFELGRKEFSERVLTSNYYVGGEGFEPPTSSV